MATNDIHSELRAAIAQLSSGKRDPDALRIADERMDRRREEIRKRIGVVNIAVDLIREARGEI